MANFDNHHDKLIILNLVDDSIDTHPHSITFLP